MYTLDSRRTPTNDSRQRIRARRSSSVHSIAHIQLNQYVTPSRDPPPVVPLESRSSSTLEEIQAGENFLPSASSLEKNQVVDFVNDRRKNQFGALKGKVVRDGTEHIIDAKEVDYDNLAASSNLRGDPPRSSSFIDTDLARIAGDGTLILPVAMMATSLTCHASSPRIHMPNSGPPPDDPLGSAVHSQNHLEVLSNDYSPFDTSQAGDIMDIQPMLRDLAERASRYCTDLGDKVDRDITKIVRGGSAFVYRGILRPEGVPVAVKTFHFGHKSDSLLHEVHVWSKLCHRNVLPLLGITTKFDQTISIVSAWMTLGNAYDYVQNMEVDPRPLLVGIATGLQYLHSHKPNPIYHGDLKGLNVLISNDGRPLLVDFGFSFIVNSSDVEGGRGGTPHWMAPEQFESDECTALATAQADVWAFGMTALELFTRQRPFPEIDTLPRLIIRIILRGPPDRPSDETTCFRLTDEWWNICLSCWHSDPMTRPRISDILAKFPMDSPDQ
ncbi:hypothetical protein SCLCIDRAFT_30817 [Scleroderma citrinum Foug A]|uniref:Protein kinase domain-containing protein n=1 Tax=Scleroderma citrinum Foug A TaxID=1036808 RepID=A0A0C3DFI5_9AGAM|nr:hypothetical protein SCLCIDRAFT_30817 [Scleroderma citrinum Foug A]